MTAFATCRLSWHVIRPTARTSWMGFPRRLLPDLYYLGAFRGSAVYAFVAASRLFVVDAPGGPGLADFIDERLRPLGLEPKRPAAVLLTSCNHWETAGLQELVKNRHVEVVASPEGLSVLEKRCPAGTVFVSAFDLASRGWFPVVPIVLGGRGLFPIAYQLELSGKRVLFSGMIPVKLNQPAGDRLIQDLTNPPGDPGRYLASLERLESARPDLWLPLIPTDDQNANLYQDDWAKALDEDANLVRYLQSRRRSN